LGPCENNDQDLPPAVPLSGEAGDTPGAIGDGRRNTEVLLQTPECVVDGTKSAVTVAAGYRGLGLDDWYLPSEDELRALCLYEGRDAIGGFNSYWYVSSTTNYNKKNTDFRAINFKTLNSAGCSGEGILYYPLGLPEIEYKYRKYQVRPIRAFA
jgi:hypothetical protein